MGGSERRWLGIPGALYLELAAGTAYAFGIYSSQLKASLGVNQTQLNAVSSIGNVGMYLGLDGGFFYDRFGARWTTIIGAAVAAVGYVLAYLCTAGAFPGGGVAAIAAAFAVCWHGGAWLDTAAVSTNMINFPHDRGRVLGVIKSFFGLSGSIFALVYLCLFQHDTASKSNSNNVASVLVIVIGVANCAGRISAGYLSDKLRGKVSRPSLFALAQVIMAIGCALFALAPDNAASSCPAKTNGSGGSVPVLLFLAVASGVLGIVAVPLVATVPPPRPPIVSTHSPYLAAGYVIIIALCAYLSTSGALLNNWKDDGTLGAHQSTRIGFIIGLAIFLVALSGIALPARRGARDPEDSTRPPSDGSRGSSAAEAPAPRVSVREATLKQAVRCFDFWLLTGAHFVGTGAGLMALNNLGQIAIALGASAWVYAGCALVGFSYGCFWCLTPVLIAELFGNGAFGSIYGAVSLFPAAGSVLFSVVLAARVYAEHKEQGANCCLGPECYQATFMVCVGTTGVLGSVACAALAWRNRSFYAAQGVGYVALEEDDTDQDVKQRLERVQ